MERNWLQHCASKEQLDFFDEWGYLVIDNALSEEQVEKMTVAIDRVDATERAAHGLKLHQTMANFRTIVEDGLFLDLLDNDKVFPLAWDTLGWNIQHYISHLIVYPPEAEGSEINLGGWHQDGGRPVLEMERPHPRLSYKVSFWFSDTRVPNSGAMRIIPGSHRFDEKPLQETFDQPLHVEVAPGTAVLFDRRLWHARGVNTSDVTSKVIFIGYRWRRGLHYNNFPEEILAQCDPIRRQLTGDGVDVKGWWQPTDADVPLKIWIETHRGKEHLVDISGL